MARPFRRKPAKDKQAVNDEYIKNLAGDPPKNSDKPTVSIYTKQVNNGTVEVLDPTNVIVQNTGNKTYSKGNGLI